MENKQNKKEPKCVNFDVCTIQKCNKFAESHGLSFSSVVRLAINGFFLKQEKD